MRKKNLPESYNTATQQTIPGLNGPEVIYVEWARVDNDLDVCVASVNHQHDFFFKPGTPVPQPNSLLVVEITEERIPDYGHLCYHHIVQQ